MEIPAHVELSREDKGKMQLVEAKITPITDLMNNDYNKTIEAIVYRKWTSKTAKTRIPRKFCCILLDRQGTPIQANMGLRDADYFDQLLLLHKAYRFSNFSCEPTEKWERTLPTELTLTFGKSLDATEIPANDFPEHFFSFAAYNELQDRLTARNQILTDYIGRIRAVGRVETKGDAMSTRKLLRVIDIENFSENVIGCTFWNEMATDFDEQTCAEMEKPVVIAVTSCFIKHYHGLQLSATSATHYYLDPNIPETFQIKEMCMHLPQPGLILEVINRRYQDVEQEKFRNRFPLAVLRQVDPLNYQGVRFTAEATIVSVNRFRRWYYQKCSQCGQKLKEEILIPKCKDHGLPTAEIYSYCFKTLINDGTATTPMTCFSNQVHAITTDVNQIIANLTDKNPFALPPHLQELEGTTHVFQFHFDSVISSARPDLVLEKVFVPPILPLPAPPLTDAPTETQELPHHTQLLEPEHLNITEHPSTPIHEETSATFTPPPAITPTVTPKDVTPKTDTDSSTSTSSIKKKLFKDRESVADQEIAKKKKHD